MRTRDPFGRGDLFSSKSASLLTTFCLLSFVTSAFAYHTNRYFETHGPKERAPPRWGPPTKRDGTIPLVVSNLCPNTIWPGIGTQAGTGPGTGGFELATGDSMSLAVSADWQGRVWGRTNCSFNVAGTGAANLNGNNGGGAACDSGDCGGVLNCVMTGVTPVTLAEFDLAGGTGNKQTFYDISLVDGYNIPLGIIYIPGDNPDLQDIPPNFTNAACIATAGYLAAPATSGTNGNSTNSTYPLPWESTFTNDQAADWCPWDLQVTQPTKPGGGVYPYPDGDIERPIFDPCLSDCSKTNSPQDCCTGAYSDRSKCSPPPFAVGAKAICPDAYSYAFDDETSTFIIPTGGGWEVQFCPEGRSTNILNTFKSQMEALSSKGVSKDILQDAGNLTLIAEAAKSEGSSRIVGGGIGRFTPGSIVTLVVLVGYAVVW